MNRFQKLKDKLQGKDEYLILTKDGLIDNKTADYLTKKGLLKWEKEGE